MNPMRMVPAATALVSLAACGGGGGGAVPARALTVMTQNLYFGTDVDPVVAALAAGDPDALVAAVTEAWAEIRAADFPARAQTLADEIERTRPDLVGLQEAALFRSQTPADSFDESPTPALTVELDYVQVLLDALAQRGLHYEVVASEDSLDAEFPGLADDGVTLLDLRLTDRDVLLARVAAESGGVRVSNGRSGVFAATAPLAPGLDVPAAWVSADVDLGGTVVRVVSTHLVSDVEDVQRAQAAEVLGVPAGGAANVVLMGDFNSDALGGPGADHTATYADLLAAGLADAWPIVRPGDAGTTWGSDPALTSPASVLVERIDYVFFEGGLDVLSAERLGTDATDVRDGRRPSDHAGLVATIRAR